MIRLTGRRAAARAEFPDRPVRLIVPAAGGTVDILARLLAEENTGSVLSGNH